MIDIILQRTADTDRKGGSLAISHVRRNVLYLCFYSNLPYANIIIHG